MAIHRVVVLFLKQCMTQPNMCFLLFVVAIIGTPAQMVDIKGPHFKTGSCDVRLDFQHEQLETHDRSYFLDNVTM